MKHPFRGFTLIELLVVTAIIAILTALIGAWGVGAWRASKVRTTHATMNAALALVTTLQQKSLIAPDHRYANFYWVQPHPADGSSPSASPGASARQMSSAEFLVWLAGSTSSTANPLESIGRSALVASSAPSAWVLTPGVNQESGTGIVLVDVYEQNPEQTLPLLKSPLSADGTPPAGSTYALVSGVAGHRLRTLVDAWGDEVVYRRSTHYELLNTGDTETAAAPFNTVIREKVAQDEAAARARYAAMGWAVPAGELLRPALPSYPQAHFLSAGPDGKWGAFTDGNPPLHSPEADPANGHDSDGRDNLSSIEWGR